MLQDLINKFGEDKILHFCIGALICFCVYDIICVDCGNSFINLVITGIIGILFATIIGIYKEKSIDEICDLNDFFATVYGSIFTLIIKTIIYCIHLI